MVIKIDVDTSKLEEEMRRLREKLYGKPKPLPKLSARVNLKELVKEN